MTILHRFLLLLTALAVSIFTIGGCSQSPTDDSIGSISLNLTGTASSGNVYRLRDAVFNISGPAAATLSSETDPDATALVQTLVVGDYTVDLQNGWRMERVETDGTLTDVVVSLSSANPALFSVLGGAQTSVVYRFLTSEGEVVLDEGEVSIGVEVVEACIDDAQCSGGQICEPATKICVDDPGAEDLDSDGYDSTIDCDDADPNINPGALELCDGIDNDCDMAIDDEDTDAVDTTAFYQDSDGDGFGASAVLLYRCDAPSGYVSVGNDCDDADFSVNPGATEIPGDGVDQDCTGADASLLGVADLQAGDLVITEVLVNPLATADVNGEWFEVVNVSGATVDLEGLVVYDAGANSFTVAGTLVVPNNNYVVFARNGDATLNGGVTADYVYENTSLGNNTDEIYLATDATQSVVIDGVEWDRGAGWPVVGGASMNLDPAQLDASGNDLMSSWCASTSAFGSGDLGTPGAANDSCP